MLKGHLAGNCDYKMVDTLFQFMSSGFLVQLLKYFFSIIIFLCVYVLVALGSKANKRRPPSLLLWRKGIQEWLGKG